MWQSIKYLLGPVYLFLFGLMGILSPKRDFGVVLMIVASAWVIDKTLCRRAYVGSWREPSKPEAK